MTSWMERAACQGMPADVFFPPRGGSDRGVKAKEVCARCPVARECFEYALEACEDYGIWGGCNIHEIDAERWRRQRAAS